MKDVLVSVPRFEDWLRELHQEYALEKDHQTSGALLSTSAVWLMRPDDPDWIDDQRFLAIRLAVSGMLLHEAVLVDPDIRSGVPVLRGTRISIAQIITEIADGETVEGFAQEYDIDGTMIKKFLDGLAIHLDRSFAK